MSLMSRRAILKGLIGNAARHGFRPGADPHRFETKTAGEGRRHARLDRLSRADAQRDIDRDEAEPKAAAAAGLGVHQGHRLRVAGDRRRAARVPPSTGRRRDRRVPARGDGRAPTGNSATRPISRIGTATTTARDRVRSSTPRACTRWARKGNCIASTSEPGNVIWKRDLDKEYRVPQDFFGTRVDAAD